MDIYHSDTDPFLASNYNNNRLFATLADYPKYRIFTNGDIYSEKFKRFLKPHLNNVGYYYIKFHKNGKQKSFQIHRLLAMCFLPCNKNFSDITVDHININHTDNRLCNLRWLDRCGQNLNQKYKETNSGFPFITIVKSNSNKSGFRFNCKIRRNEKDILHTARVNREDAVELVRLAIKENMFVLDGYPRETVDIIKSKYSL